MKLSTGKPPECVTPFLFFFIWEMQSLEIEPGSEKAKENLI